jgi:lipid-binding SYLF domain-containing protein
MNKRFFLTALLGFSLFASGCTTTGPDSGDPAARRQSLNAGVDNALASLHRQVPGSQELVGRAKGVLVFPSVLEAGFIVGASRGDGALRVNGKTVSFHCAISRTAVAGQPVSMPRSR